MLRMAPTTPHLSPAAPALSPRRRGVAGRTPLMLVGVVVAILTAGACASSSSSAGVTAGTTAPPPTSAATATTYSSIADLHTALEAKNITCKLEYPGLKDDTAQTELSICVINGEQAFLKIWLKPSDIKDFLASPDGQTGTVAVGANWTITFTSTALANTVAKALGGTAPSGNAAAVPVPGTAG